MTRDVSNLPGNAYEYIFSYTVHRKTFVVSLNYNRNNFHVLKLVGNYRGLLKSLKTMKVLAYSYSIYTVANLCKFVN